MLPLFFFFLFLLKHATNMVNKIFFNSFLLFFHILSAFAFYLLHPTIINLACNRLLSSVHSVISVLFSNVCITSHHPSSLHSPFTIEMSHIQIFPFLFFFFFYFVFLCLFFRDYFIAQKSCLTIVSHPPVSIVLALFVRMSSKEKGTSIDCVYKRERESHKNRCL